MTQILKFFNDQGDLQIAVYISENGNGKKKAIFKGIRFL